MSIREIKAELAVADTMVMQVAEISAGAGVEVDNIDVLGIAHDIEQIPGLPAGEVPASFEAAGARMMDVVFAAGDLTFGTMVVKLRETDVAYATPWGGFNSPIAVTGLIKPPRTIVEGLEHMSSKVTELGAGHVVLAKEADAETRALFAAAQVVREQVAQSRFAKVAEFVAAEAAARAAAARDTVEPARAALKPITEEISATAAAVKRNSEEFAAVL